MDQNTELLMQKASLVQNWEDEEKASYDIDRLREEFRERLYGDAKPESAQDAETR